MPEDRKQRKVENLEGGLGRLGRTKKKIKKPLTGEEQIEQKEGASGQRIVDQALLMEASHCFGVERID